MTPLLRRATAADLPAMSLADGRAFGAHWSSESIEAFRPLFDPERFLLAADAPGGPIIGAECTRTECTGAGQGDADVIGIEMAALGSLLFGGTRAGPLARAGLFDAPDPTLLRRLDLAMLADRSPQHGSEF